jgi:hypothetical protein
MRYDEAIVAAERSIHNAATAEIRATGRCR